MPALILVVEDNPANLELMRYLLETSGYALAIATDGEGAVAAARREQPDLVICDIQLPDIDGFEVLRRLRALPGLSATVIVAVTALAMVGDRDRILAAGFTQYLSKPIEPESFVRQVEELLPCGLRAGRRGAQADSGTGRPRRDTPD